MVIVYNTRQNTCVIEQKVILRASHTIKPLQKTFYENFCVS